MPALPRLALQFAELSPQQITWTSTCTPLRSRSHPPVQFQPGERRRQALCPAEEGRDSASAAGAETRGVAGSARPPAPAPATMVDSEVFMCCMWPLVTAVFYCVLLPFSVVQVGVCGTVYFLVWWWPALAARALLAWCGTGRFGPTTRAVMLLPTLLAIAFFPVLVVLSAVLCAVFAPVAASGAMACVVLGIGDRSSDAVCGVFAYNTMVLRGGMDACGEIADGLKAERAYVPDTPPTDLNPLHLLEWLLACTLVLPVALVACIVTAVVKAVLNLISALGIIVRVHLEGLTSEFAPCVCFCFPLSFVFALVVAGPLCSALVIALAPLFAIVLTFGTAGLALRAEYKRRAVSPERGSCCWSGFKHCLLGALHGTFVHDSMTPSFANIVGDSSMFDELRGCMAPRLPTVDDEEGGFVWGSLFRQPGILDGADGPPPPPPNTGTAPRLEEVEVADWSEVGTPPPRPPTLEDTATSSLFERGAERMGQLSGALVSIPGIWNSFFTSCESFGALALANGWIRMDAVLEGDPSIFIGIPALVMLQAAHRTAETEVMDGVYLADGRLVQERGRPMTGLPGRVLREVVSMTTRLRELQLNEEEWEYLQRVCVAGGAEDVHVPMPASLQPNPADAGADEDSGSGRGDEEALQQPAPAPAPAAASGAGDATAEERRRGVVQLRNDATGLGLLASQQSIFRLRFSGVLRSISGR